ncbi:hypothetical protein ACJ73_09590, partial [Blastomyces percursus]
MLGLWCESAGISRREYEGLLEVLDTLDDISSIRRLPRTLGTLKQNLKAQFPLLELRKAEIPLNHAKLHIRQTSIHRHNMFFINPVDIVSAITQSDDFKKKVHHGMSEFVDEPKELCCDNGTACTCQPSPHIGRVISVGTDFRKAAPVPGAVTLQIQHAITKSTASQKLQELLAKGEPFADNELILQNEEFLYISPLNVIESALRYKNFLNRPYKRPLGPFVRRIVSRTFEKIWPLNLSSPPRGELEIAAYGRQKLIDTFMPGRCLSFPYQLFIDGFGLYRNMYRSLTGIYLIPAALPSWARSRREHVYNSSSWTTRQQFKDVINKLTELQNLDNVINIQIN